MELKYQSFRRDPSMLCSKCTWITFAISYDFQVQIYQIIIIWKKINDTKLGKATKNGYKAVEPSASVNVHGIPNETDTGHENRPRSPI
jgi:hypothetical protein